MGLSIRDEGFVAACLRRSVASGARAVAARARTSQCITKEAVGAARIAAPACASQTVLAKPIRCRGLIDWQAAYAISCARARASPTRSIACFAQTLGQGTHEHRQYCCQSGHIAALFGDKVT